MTSLARATIICGVLLFTAGTIAWILTGNWQWFAGGTAIFIGTILAGAILSVEVKTPSRREEKTYQPLPHMPPQNTAKQGTTPSDTPTQTQPTDPFDQ